MGVSCVAEQEWVELCQVTTEVEKGLIRSALEPYSIEVIFRSFLPPSVYPGLSPIKVFVPRKDLELARRVLAGNKGESGS